MMTVKTVSSSRPYEKDIVEKLPCGSEIHHGPASDRIYLLKIGDDNSDTLSQRLKNMAIEKGYSKIFAKVSEDELGRFIHSGFEVEAYVPGFFNGKESAFFVAFFCADKRRVEKDSYSLDAIRNMAISKALSPIKKLCPESFKLRECTKEDIAEMVHVYRIVFKSYPFPIDDPAYIEGTMDDNVDYYCVQSVKDGKIVAVASAEKSFDYANAEMTDFATLPSFRGLGFANLLLETMEEKSTFKGVKSFYTIARAKSPGMNITFSKAGYSFGGRLKNNTNISGSIESMNVWYKTPSMKA